MIRRPEELTKPIQEAVNRRAVVFSHLLLGATATVHTVLDPEASGYESVVIVILSVLLAVLIFFRFFDLASINSRPRSYLVVYSILFTIGFVMVSDPSSPYVLIFFILVFLSNLYYGAKGVFATIGVFAVTTVAKYIFLTNEFHGLNFEQKANIIATFFVFVAVSSIFINIQKVFDWDRAKLKETIRKEVIEQKRLTALINNMTESVLVLDKDSTIRVYNAATLALFDTNESLTNKVLDEVIHLEDDKGKRLFAPDLLLSDSRPFERSDVKIRYGEDDVASLSIVVTPIRPNFGYHDIEAGYVVTLRDITREKSLEEERDEFISVISHELRTPVTVVEAGVSNSMMIANGLPGGEKLQNSLKMAHDQALFLANMLNDLSTFARAEKGALEMELEEIDPRDLIKNLEETYKDEAKAKGLALDSKSEGDVMGRMVSNRLYVREILQNFITNAIKYSDKGTITITAKPKNKGVLFSVVDEGIGLSVSDQKKVFNKFYRAEDYRTRATSGTGLGLYISKKLAKLLDASFELESEVGRGSTFSVYVPDKRDEMNEATAKAPAAEAQPAAPVPLPAAPTEA